VSRGRPRSPGQAQRDVDDHVLLAADEAAAAGLDEDLTGVEAVVAGGPFGVPQEARTDPGVAQRQRLAVDADRAIGPLPAPAPCPARDASTRVTPSSTATTELATERERFSCAWMPI
jgi:hypothetical protein